MNREESKKQRQLFQEGFLLREGKNDAGFGRGLEFNQSSWSTGLEVSRPVLNVKCAF